MSDEKGQGREPGYKAEARAFLDPDRTDVEVRIGMLDDELARAQRLTEENGWKPDEGLHIIFSRGLVSLEHERTGGPEVEGRRLLDTKTPEERDRFLLARLSDLESRYSVMKFTAFNALRDNETLRMNVTGFKSEHEPLAEQNKYLRKREDELRARVDQLQREVAQLKARLQARTTRPPTRWQRVRELLRALIE
jgi:uncharacterized small protein (DUF1192 family)